jgi:hypothetical protein
VNRCYSHTASAMIYAGKRQSGQEVNWAETWAGGRVASLDGIDCSG